MNRTTAPRRAVRTLALALGVLLVLAGCADVPEESQPQVVQQVPQVEPEQVPKPELGLDPLSVVRSFVKASGQPLRDHASARVYLDPPARQNWRPGTGVTIIKQSFNTLYAPADEQPPAPNERIVRVSGSIVGTLGQDQAFIPAVSQQRYETNVLLRQQPSGEWRIADPPSGVVVTKPDFTEHYFRVPIYFFAPNSGALVPDLRYIAAKPQADMPSKVIGLLLSGPSDGLTGAVRNPLGENASLEGNVRSAPDGALVVPLTGVAGRSEQDKQLIVAQLVKSLRIVAQTRIRPLSDGASLVEGQLDWRAGDLPAYGAPATLSSNLTGLYVRDGRVFTLGDGQPVAGAAGSGVLNVRTAAQSINGDQLAVVEQVGEGVRLRVGPLNNPVQIVDLPASTMTRPTWRPSSSVDAPSHDVWTVVDGKQVVRVRHTPAGTWVPQRVNAQEIAALGEITALRLSRDGTRVAAVAGGKLVVASVVRESGAASLQAPKVLQRDNLADVVAVTWAKPDTVVVTTTSGAVPVARLPVDGLRLDSFNSANLSPPVHAVTSAPGRPVVVADRVGLWKAGDIGEVWRPQEPSVSDAIPFYPG